jgi:hypothetical protein
MAAYTGCMASGPLSCHTGAGEFGDGESLSRGDGVGDGESLFGGDGVGDGESLYGGGVVRCCVLVLCPTATPVPTPATASTAMPVSKVIFARLIMDTPLGQTTPTPLITPHSTSQGNPALVNRKVRRGYHSTDLTDPQDTIRPSSSTTPCWSTARHKYCR